MKSIDLSKYGFGSWMPFNRDGHKSFSTQVPISPGAYVLRCCRDYGRRIGTSDILYIGSATNSRGLRMRLYQYFHPGPTQRTNKRILALVGDCSDFEVAFAITKSIPEAKMLEASLLEKYETDHGELPPENHRR